MFFRLKSTGKYCYVQIAHSVREGRKVRQQVIATLGRLDALQASGQFDSLMRSGARFSQRVAVIDAHAAGETEAVRVWRLGPDLVFSRLWQETGVAAALHGQLQSREYEFEVERAVYLTVLHRLFASGSDRAAERWREDYRIPGAEGLELHHLYRAMAFLGEALEPADAEALGTPRCTKDRIEEALFDRRRDLFSEVDLVFFDTTSIYFEGEGGTIGRRGHSKDHRPDLKQMVVGVAMDVEGRPICCEMWPGNTTDVTTLAPVVERMHRRFRVREVCIVADRGMISDEIIRAFEGHEPPVRYILGVRMRNQKEVSQQVLASRKPWIEITPERQQAKDPAPLKIKEVQIEGRRYIVCLNEEERRKDAHDREAIVASLRQQLGKGDKALVGNKGYRRYLKADGPRFSIDPEAIKEEARYDGIWVLRTNTDLEAETVAATYKHLWMVETIFRTTKTILETRPIYHKRDETIRGHVFCSYLALLLKWELEERMRQAGLAWEWAEVVRGLDALQEVEADLQGKRFVLRSEVRGHASQALRAVGAALPPTLREITA
jgi:hypothetical protein